MLVVVATWISHGFREPLCPLAIFCLILVKETPSGLHPPCLGDLLFFNADALCEEIGFFDFVIPFFCDIISYFCYLLVVEIPLIYHKDENITI